MEKEAFREWLIKNESYTTTKQISDCLSRVRRTEEALIEAGLIDENLEAAFCKDGGVGVRLLLCRKGKKISESGVSVKLPIGSLQMSPIAASVRKYFLFKSEAKQSGSVVGDV